MKRRIIYRVVIVLFVVGLIVWSFIYFGPLIVINTGPIPTSIYNGNINIELINTLRAPQPNGEINRDQAIGLAELYCVQMNGSQSQVDPYRIRAVHLTEAQATHRLMAGNYSTSSTPVWFVSMNGQWEHTRVPVPPSPGTPPIVFAHCQVIINAKTGEFDGGTN